MTSQKHLKARIRTRMQKTGERYTVARRQVVAKATQPQATGPERFHLPGNIPATTALRVLLAAAAESPPMSEAMLLGIAGGVGAGVFSFRYEQEDFSSFFVAGRHLWQDDLAYLRTVCARLGVEVNVQETGGVKTAEKQLRAGLDDNAPLIAWVDMAALPHHGSQQAAMGGQYHVVSVYGIDDACSQALIGDLADLPSRISLEKLSEARGRIKKQKNRLLWVTKAPGLFDFEQAIIDGITACHDGLIGRGKVKPPGGKSMAANFTLDAFQKWGERMHGSSNKQSWSQIFPRGVNLWRGLTSVYSFIHYGTGGGLTRPLYSQFFREAQQIVAEPLFTELSERYEKLGADWDALGEAALPDDVDLFRQFKQLSVERAELTLSADDSSAERLAKVLHELAELETTAKRSFPLTEAECDALRAELKHRVLELHAQEVAAHQQLHEVIAGRR